MLLSDLSVKRPVLASVINLLLIVFGMVAFAKLPLREYPDVDPPVVSIETIYPGAAASVVETRITEVLEERLAGIEGIKSIASSSLDGRSTISIEFTIERDIDNAANDVRDRVSGAMTDLPREIEAPMIQKVDADADPILWLNLESDTLSVMEITDYADRYLVDRFSSLDGVARVRLGGGLEQAMRVWLDRQAMAAHNITVQDVENALRAENIELPAGNVESRMRDFTVRLERGYQNADDFQQLVLRRGQDGYLVRLGDIARVEIAPREERNFFRGNGKPMVGIGIIKQSTANTLEVAERAKTEAARLAPSLPDGMRFQRSYDSSVFIKSAIHEVYLTLAIAIALVILVIYLFLGNWRAVLIPAVSVPVSIIATFIVLWALGYTINLLTLLALVLAIGLVVDDAIVVLENIYRRIELGESPLVASFRGARQVGIAVIATTLVLVAVFVPITFLEGTVGRLFSEFAVAIATAVLFSALVALSLGPMLSSLILAPQGASHGRLTQRIDAAFERSRLRYLRALEKSIHHPRLTLAGLAFIGALAAFLFQVIPDEFAPKEDRGSFFVLINGPEGATYEYLSQHLEAIEERLMPMVKNGEIDRMLLRAPRSFGDTDVFSNGIAIVILDDWSNRRSAWEIMDDVRARLGDLPGVNVYPIMRQGLGQVGLQKPMQFVLGGASYEELARWRDLLMEEARKNPQLVGLDYDYKETKPQLRVRIDRDRAGDLGVSMEQIGRTLETMLGMRQVTTFIDRGEEYDVIVEGERTLQRNPSTLENIYVRSERSGRLIPLANLVHTEEYADSLTLNRYNRVRAISIESNLAQGYTLGEALRFLEERAKAVLPPEAKIDYKGESLEYKRSGSSVSLVFMLSLIVVYLFLAGQFESFLHPFVILLTVPLAIAGALLGLWMGGYTVNIYSQIGMIMLVGLATKNGILIVEFINQLRDQGVAYQEAILEASSTRLRPIIMTSVTTVMGAVPLMLTSGAGSETRTVIGIVVIAGVLFSTVLTLFVVPVVYALVAQRSGSPKLREKVLEDELKQTPDQR
jgi:multidrug efflux pump